MNLDELERLAKAATQGRGVLWNDANVKFYHACDPQTILALIACVRAADAMRAFAFTHQSTNRLAEAYDAASNSQRTTDKS